MSAARPRILPPVWFLLSLAASFALDRWLPIRELLAHPWNLVGIAWMLLGLVMTITASGAFKRAGTPVVPFEPSTALVTTGWYQHTRNPMYLGLVLILIGVGLMFGSLGAILPVPIFTAILNWGFIKHEEQFLTEIFGEPYLAYRARVRRWF